jgi:hypothetical protein
VPGKAAEVIGAGKCGDRSPHLLPALVRRSSSSTTAGQASTCRTSLRPDARRSARGRAARRLRSCEAAAARRQLRRWTRRSARVSPAGAHGDHRRPPGSRTGSCLAWRSRRRCSWRTTAQSPSIHETMA